MHRIGRVTSVCGKTHLFTLVENLGYRVAPFHFISTFSSITLGTAAFWENHRKKENLLATFGVNSYLSGGDRSLVAAYLWFETVAGKANFMSCARDGCHYWCENILCTTFFRSDIDIGQRSAHYRVRTELNKGLHSVSRRYYSILFARSQNAEKYEEESSVISFWEASIVRCVLW